MIARTVLRFARWADVEAYFLQTHGGWRWRVGSTVECWASHLAAWAWRQGAR